MKNKFIIALIMSSFLFNSGCELIRGSDDDLNLTRIDYNGNELRIDGFYHTKKENSEGFYYSIFFLYRNGIIRSGGAVDSTEERDWLMETFKTVWGVFNVDETNIKFEKWYPSSGGPQQAYVREGAILNDTSFHITESYRMVDGEKTEVREKDEIYYFYKFSPKPDSTNQWIP